MSVMEDERDISEAEYLSLKENIKPGTSPIYKTRHTFLYGNRVIEIDIYPEWRNSCIMEIELASRTEILNIPSFIEIIKEVTGDKRYSNAAMSNEFPKEDHL